MGSFSLRGLRSEKQVCAANVFRKTTEIQPPPVKKSSKKPRTRPCPMRPKAGESPNANAPLEEPQNDISD